MITGAIQAVRRSYGPSLPDTNGLGAYAPDVFAGDALFCDVRLESRPIGNVPRCGTLCKSLLGMDRINLDKPGIEGTCGGGSGRGWIPHRECRIGHFLTSRQD